MRSLLVSAVAMLAWAGPVSAQPAAYNWTGFYLGIGAGYGATNDDVDQLISTFVFEDHIRGLGSKGPLVEGTIGADLQLGSGLVVGALADAYWFDAHHLKTINNPITPRFDSVTIDRDYGFDLLLRAGVLTDDRTLVYALGGYSLAHVVGKLRTEIGSPPTSTFTANGDQTLSGWTIGAGIEARINQAWSVKAEYRYSEFGGLDVVGDFGDFRINPSQGTFRVAANYRLGQSSLALAPMPAGPALHSWTGFYVGAAGGYGFANDAFQQVVGPTVLALDGYGADGFLAEGTIGVDHQVGPRLVVGVLADMSWFHARHTEDQLITNTATTDFEHTTLNIDRSLGFDLLARAGVLVNDRALLYGLGGVSIANVAFDLRRESGTGGIVTTSLQAAQAGSIGGWTIGGGIEARITDALSVKAEYRYSHFAKQTFSGDAALGDLTLDPSQQTFRIGLNYRLGTRP